MPYCSTDDVQALNRARTIGANGQPTVADVQILINMAAGEIDAVLVNKGYAVPVDLDASPAAVAYLNSINARGAVAMMERSAPSSPNLDRFEREWEQAKTDLVAARSVMDLLKDETRSGPRGPGVTRTPQLPWSDKPFFRRRMEF